VQLQKLVFDPNQVKRSKLDRRQKALEAEKSPIIQIHTFTKDENTYILVLKKNYVFEVIENFATPIYLEQITKLLKLQPTYGD